MLSSDKSAYLSVSEKCLMIVEDGTLKPEVELFDTNEIDFPSIVSNENSSFFLNASCSFTTTTNQL